MQIEAEKEKPALEFQLEMNTIFNKSKKPNGKIFVNYIIKL